MELHVSWVRFRKKMSHAYLIVSDDIFFDGFQISEYTSMIFTPDEVSLD